MWRSLGGRNVVVPRSRSFRCRNRRAISEATEEKREHSRRLGPTKPTLTAYIQHAHAVAFDILVKSAIFI
eukprot:scaffold292881_cov31-Tisochrysis_lutea.AAC.1